MSLSDHIASQIMDAAMDAANDDPVQAREEIVRMFADMAAHIAETALGEEDGFQLISDVAASMHLPPEG